MNIRMETEILDPQSLPSKCPSCQRRSCRIEAPEQSLPEKCPSLLVRGLGCRQLWGGLLLMTFGFPRSGFWVLSPQAFFSKGSNLGHTCVLQVSNPWKAMNFQTTDQAASTEMRI